MNRMHFGLRLLLGIMGVLLLGACQRSREGSPTDGQLSGPYYTNRFFGLSIRVPSGWTVSELKPTFVPPKNSPRPPPPKSSAQSAYQLLMLSEKPLSTAQVNNGSLLVMAEEAAKVPGVKSARDYLARVSQLMIDAPIAYHPVAGMVETKLGGTPAWRMDFTARLGPNKTVNQTYIVCQRHGYALSFILSGTTPAEIQRLEQVVQAARFE